MIWLYFLKGLMIGLSISAPIGPMGVLCIRRTLSAGRTSGLFTGMGVATADAFYSSIVAFSLVFLSNTLLEYGFLLRLTGGLVLCLFGARIFFEKAQAPLANGAPPAMRLASIYFSSLFLGLSNPIAIVFFTAVFAGSGLADTGGDARRSLLLVMGLCSGSMLWWTFLSTCVAALGARLSPKILRYINRVAGLLIAGFGIAVLVNLPA